MPFQVAVPTIGKIRAALEGVATTEARLAASAVLIVAGLAIGLVVLPLVLRRTGRTVTDRLVTGRVADALSLIGEYIPRTAGDAVLRFVQAAVLVATVGAVLLVWGLTGVVIDASRWLLRSVPVIGQVTLSIVVLGGTYVVFQLLGDLVDRFADDTRWMTDHQEEILLRVSQLGLFVVSGLALLTVWGVNPSGLLVGAGFIGIVVGFAARQTLGSIIAGFLLMFSRPFTIGDWVAIGDNEGVVTDITIVHTRLENFDGETVIVPNDRVSDRSIVNRSNRGGLRLKVDVGIDYESDPDYAGDVALEAMKAIDLVADGPPPQVVPKAFGDSAVVLELRFWINQPTPPRKWQAISDVVTGVKAAFEAEGIKIPYPQRELSGREETGGFRVHDGTHAADEADAVEQSVD
ncbi:MAG: mechanosensitive ion channel family protein [Haloarculaceae archaeon]